VSNSFLSGVPSRDKDPWKVVQVSRRRPFRLPPRLGVSCSILEEGDSMGSLAQVIDLTQIGVQLLTHQCYEPGTCLRITLSNAAELFRLSSVIVVQFAVVTTDGSHITGCEFLQNLAYDDLRALLA
jgi:hypothetical protein